MLCRELLGLNQGFARDGGNGASPGGSMMMKSVVNAVMRAGSSVIGPKGCLTHHSHGPRRGARET